MRNWQIHHSLMFALILILGLLQSRVCTGSYKAASPIIVRPTQVILVASPQQSPTPADISEKPSIIVVHTSSNPTKSDGLQLSAILVGLFGIIVMVFMMFLLRRLTRRDQSVEALKKDVEQMKKDMEQIKSYIDANSNSV